MTIWTHIQPDLDAAASVWAVRRYHGRRDDPVSFKPANWDGEGADPGDAIVDIDCPGGVKGEIVDGKRRSAFASLMTTAPAEHREALRHVIDFVDRVDSGEPALLGLSREEFLRDFYPVTLAGVWRALALTHEDQAEAIEAFGKVLDGLLKMRLERLRAEKAADAAEWVEHGVLRAAVIRDAGVFGVNAVLFERGADVVVFTDGHNIGAVRSDRHGGRTLDAEPLRSLVAGEEGWFFHPAGFLAARGTRKAPAASPSCVQPERLAEAALQALAAQS